MSAETSQSESRSCCVRECCSGDTKSSNGAAQTSDTEHNLSNRRPRAVLRDATERDREAVSELLKRTRLAALDEWAQFGPHYILAVDDKRVLGVAGVEVYGKAGLLRSVAVLEEARSQGLGERLIDNRLGWAAGRGVTELYLLTTDARSYWLRQGFTDITRTEAPAEIRTSTQWKGGCSETAFAMKRQIANAN